MTKRFSMNVEGKRKEHIDDLAIAESTLPEERRKKPSFAEKTRFQCKIWDLRIEDSIVKYDSRAEKHHL